jgi:glycosyltransferase involved in cell wall biosynthesis
MAQLSVVIITFNEEHNIGRCIDSVKMIADEIIVLDSYSTDQTVSIARDKGALVSQDAFSGYVTQKNKALALASNDFVLSLDADEALSEELSHSIISMKSNFVQPAYKMNRRAFYCGRFITHGTWYPEPKIRLFNRKYARWGGLDPHDRVLLDRGIKPHKINGDILHYICDTVEQHRKRSDNFSSIAAESMHRAGRTTNWLKIIGSPTWFFIADYLIRGGFLSGWRGWRIATNQMRYHFLKYLKLRRLNKENR